MTKKFKSKFDKAFDQGDFHIEVKMEYVTPSHFEKLKHGRHEGEDIFDYLTRVLPTAYESVESVEIRVFKKKKKGKGDKQPDYSKDTPIQVITDKEEVLYSEISSDVLNFFYADWSTGIPLGKTTAV